MILTKEKIKDAVLTVFIAGIIFFYAEPTVYLVKELVADTIRFVNDLEYLLFDYKLHPVEEFLIRLMYAVSLDYVLIKICSYTLKAYPSKKSDILSQRPKIKLNDITIAL